MGGDDFYKIRQLSTKAMLYVDSMIRGEDLRDYKEDVRKLSDIFLEMSQRETSSLMLDKGIFLTKVVYGNMKDKNRVLTREDLKGKTPEDLKLQSWLFARDLSTIESFSKERQAEILEQIIHLSECAESEYRGYFGRRFAA